MGNTKLRARRVVKSAGRPKLRLLLTDSGMAELDRVVAETGAWTRSLVVAEAIHAGILNPNFPFSKENRYRIVDVRVSKQLIEDIKQLAKSRSLTQQSLLRQLLSYYLTHLPRESAEHGTEEEHDLEEVAVR